MNSSPPPEQHPYRGLPPRAFWKTAVADRHFFDITDLATPKRKIRLEDRIATAGSCFAQHIARRLRGSGFDFIDMEPAPSRFLLAESQSFGYGLFSARYGNVYTSRQLNQLWLRAHGQFEPLDNVWGNSDRFYDPFRPSIEPNGFGSAEEVHSSRESHLAAVRRLFRRTDVFIFTMGLTEVWVDQEDGAAFPVCPGTQAGQFDSDRHLFVNLSFNDVMLDMNKFMTSLRRQRPGIHLILTVSPVPLAATASGGHVLTATTHSKSVLRAVAGELASTNEDIDYFPSYEIITSPAFQGVFYDVGQREIRPEGVDFVMRQFERQFCEMPAFVAKVKDLKNEEDVLCDEKMLENCSQ
jgi:hypothetical protein